MFRKSQLVLGFSVQNYPCVLCVSQTSQDGPCIFKKYCGNAGICKAAGARVTVRSPYSGNVDAAVRSTCIAGLQVHLILRHKSPKTGVIEEKHLKTPPMVMLDEYTHVYTAILYAANDS